MERFLKSDFAGLGVDVNVLFNNLMTSDPYTNSSVKVVSDHYIDKNGIILTSLSYKIRRMFI